MMKFARGPAKPFLKWAGGKTQIIDQIWNNLPESFSDYYEPFLGGASVFYLIFNNQARLCTDKEKGKRKYVLSDLNQELIETYLAVRNELDLLLPELMSLQKMVNKKDYYRIREQIPSDRIKRAARFIYLNKTCYNGLYRVNKEGHFNVPWNGVKSTRIFNKSHLHEVSEALKHTELVACDFATVLARPKRGDLIYADPPYHSEGFRDYTSAGFHEQDHAKLAQSLTKIAKKGCYVLHSNSSTELIENLYSNSTYHRIIIKSRRMINRDGKGRKPVPELLIRNYHESDTIGHRFEQKLLGE